MIKPQLGRNDPCACGSGRKYKLCCLQRVAPVAAPIEAGPTLSKLRNDALAHLQAGRLAETDAVCDEVLRRSPSNGDARHIKALVQHHGGRHVDALEWVNSAIAVDQNFSMYSTRGLVLQALGRLDEAIESFRRAAELNPASVQVHCNLGLALFAARQHEQARTSLLKALILDPRHAPAHNGLGICLLEHHQDLPQAEACFRQALAVQPGYGAALRNLGIACYLQRKVGESIASYRVALQADPRQVEVADRLATALAYANQPDEALQVLQAAQASAPSLERQVRLALMLSSVYASKTQLLEWRCRFERQLELLIASNEPMASLSIAAYSTSLFNLAYHAMNDRPVMERVATMYRELLPALAWEAPHVQRAAAPGARLRLGFFSVHVHRHSVALSYAGIVQALATDAELDVFLVSTQNFDSPAVKHMYEGFAGTTVRVEDNLLQARETIAALELDVLVYQDIGMEAQSYFLAFARLARVQCVMGGHPVTTGLATMDEFISSDLAEPADGQAHYSERLVRLPIGVFFFNHPAVPTALKGREALGLPTAGTLYLCPMMLQKIHPDFDAALSAILQADPSGHVVLFDSPEAPWREPLERRFDTTISGSVRARLHFLPWVRDLNDFIAVNSHGSVVLDPFHFGIGSTAIPVFAAGTPIVTWPGAFLRGRVGLAYSKLLDLPECVARDHADYVARAVAIATDSALRKRLSQRIAANKHRLYASAQVIADLRQHFLGLGQRLRLPAGSEAEALS